MKNYALEGERHETGVIVDKRRLSKDELIQQINMLNSEIKEIEQESISEARKTHYLN